LISQGAAALPMFASLVPTFNDRFREMNVMNGMLLVHELPLKCFPTYNAKNFAQRLRF
jgi:hypothetical protein